MQNKMTKSALFSKVLWVVVMQQYSSSSVLLRCSGIESTSDMFSVYETVLTCVGCNAVVLIRKSMF